MGDAKAPPTAGAACALADGKALGDAVGVTFKAPRDNGQKCQWDSDPAGKGNASVVIVIHPDLDTATKRAAVVSKDAIWKDHAGVGDSAKMMLEPPRPPMRPTELPRKIVLKKGEMVVEVEVVKMTRALDTIAGDLDKVAKIVASRI